MGILNFKKKNQIPDSHDKKSEIIIGPFETKNRIGLTGLDKQKLYLITLDFSTLLKYSISVQLPIFTRHIEKLKTNTLDDLIGRYKSIGINYSDLLDIQVKRSNWKNYISIEFDNKTIKWNIIESHETERYDEIFNKLKESTICQQCV